MDWNFKALLGEAKTFVLREYSSHSYQFWMKLIDDGPLFIPHPHEPEIEIEISCLIGPFNSEEAIRVLVSIYEVYPNINMTSVPTCSFLVFSDGRLNALTQETFED